MIKLSIYQRIYVLFYLCFLHLLVIVFSNYLVQLPVSIFGLHATWGTFSFPLIFLVTDLTVRIFHVSLARRIILLAMGPALCISYLISCLFYQGEWQSWIALKKINLFSIRIALASFIAYLFSQFLDVYIFNYMRKHFSLWWVPPILSMFFGNIIDTATFFFIAFYKSLDIFMATHWIEIAIVDASFKILICIIFFLPFYRILLTTILKALTIYFNSYAD
ncbi:7-cyano-7-deazaguanine/7-aminomethyl-7-deazaguanine transporter [Candidatus Pantoea carbekii]|uniref:7-cyano-7-deazaguanine/7-aminomethyl-7- deazaguanine transporter n=1 Tax=Candidatus Pantoea carbekii TaxID=1235990 RepID=UPI0004AE1802|nr:7-cyano-7-deazaguanine/7-aminomethyl-7-deazaguanine transporter [Candidatus Pantoea carbekii]AKC32372.1 inner membrane protein YhhQ [Candidatus Pantoea carbekii]